MYDKIIPCGFGECTTKMHFINRPDANEKLNQIFGKVD